MPLPPVLIHPYTRARPTPQDSSKVRLHYMGVFGVRQVGIKWCNMAQQMKIKRVYAAKY